MISLAPLMRLVDFSVSRLVVRVGTGYPQPRPLEVFGEDYFKFKIRSLNSGFSFIIDSKGVERPLTPDSSPLSALNFITWAFSAWSEGDSFWGPLSVVLTNLKEMGQRMEVWRVHELSGGSREWTILWRSAPVAQISIAPLIDAGLLAADWRVLRFDAQGGLPMFGRNSEGSFSQFDRFVPTNLPPVFDRF